LKKYLGSTSPAPVATEISAELMQLFFDGMVKKRQNLVDGLTQLDWQLISDTAHTIQGSAASFGFPRLSESAGELEQMMEEEERELVTVVVMRLTAEIDQVLSASATTVQD
jgi:HPt (histidine-containing phosphotransfer) domain-containing protein